MVHLEDGATLVWWVLRNILRGQERRAGLEEDRSIKYVTLEGLGRHCGASDSPTG